MALLLPKMSSVLPSPHHMTDAHGESVPTDLPEQSASLPQRKKPRLSLQTAALGTVCGSSVCGLGSNTSQIAFTPTTANTLSNTWDISIRPSPTSRTESPRPQTVRQQQQPYVLALPFGVRSILRNSPIPKQTSVSASPRDSRRKAFFPQPKKVSFRKNLEDAIETQGTVDETSDLSSSDQGASSDEELSRLIQEDNDVISPGYPSPKPSRKRKERREALDSTKLTEQDCRQEQASIMTSHASKRRKWQWTLPAQTKLTTSTQTTDLLKTEATAENMLVHPDDNCEEDLEGTEEIYTSHLDISKTSNDVNGETELASSGPLPVVQSGSNDESSLLPCHEGCKDSQQSSGGLEGSQAGEL